MKRVVCVCVSLLTHLGRSCLSLLLQIFIFEYYVTIIVRRTSLLFVCFFLSHVSGYCFASVEQTACLPNSSINLNRVLFCAIC